MAATAIVKIGTVLTLDNGKVFTLFEGDIIRGLEYEVGGNVRTLEGTVRVINANTRANSVIPSDCPPEPYVHRYVTATSIVIDSSAEFDADLTRVMVGTITDIGSVEPDGGVITVGVGAQYKALTDVIADAPEGATIKLTAGEYTAPLNLTKSVTLEGGTGVVFTGALSLGSATTRSTETEPVSITLRNLDMSGDSLISIGNVDEFTMTGCTFANHNMPTAKTYAIRFLTEYATKVVIDNNVFGDEPANSYNLIECLTTLKDGSSFCGNKFAAACCKHNQIGMYNCEDGATIRICDNEFDYSYSGIRIGFKGAVQDAKVYIQNNLIHSTSTDAYAGMCTVQPYAKATTDFSGVTVYVDDNSIPNGTIVYMYLGANDTQLTVEQYPVYYLEGELTVMPLIA